jgi:hypothetical protein
MQAGALPRRVSMILAQLEANAALERKLVDGFQELAKRDASYREPEEYKASLGLLKGRLPRPVLRHLYLLGYYPMNDTQLEAKAALAKYPFEPVRYHYRRSEQGSPDAGVVREYPQAFLINFLVNAMKDDISRGSANKIITLLSALGYLRRTGCVTGVTSFAVAFGPELRTLIEDWIDLSTPVVGVTP